MPSAHDGRSAFLIGALRHSPKQPVLVKGFLEALLSQDGPVEADQVVFGRKVDGNLSVLSNSDLHRV